MILKSIDSLILEAARWKKQAGLTHQGTKSFGKKVGKNTSLYGQKRLSKDSLEKIRQAGIIKPKEEYQAGIDYGSKQIANKADTKIIPNSDRSHFTYNNSNNTRVINTQGNPLATRHEALEARSSHNYPAENKIYKGKIEYGNHFSPKILQDEKRLHDQYKTLYGEKLYPRIANFRKKSKEYQNFVQNLSDKDINKAENKRQSLTNKIQRLNKTEDKLVKRSIGLREKTDSVIQREVNKKLPDTLEGQKIQKLKNRYDREASHGRWPFKTERALEQLYPKISEPIEQEKNIKKERIREKIQAKRDAITSERNRIGSPLDHIQIDLQSKKLKYKNNKSSSKPQSSQSSHWDDWNT